MSRRSNAWKNIRAGSTGGLAVACTSPPESRRGKGRTANPQAKRLSVEWSGMDNSTPIMAMIGPSKPSVWRRSRRNTPLRVKAVSIAVAEYRACPLRVVRGRTYQSAKAAGANQVGKRL